MALPLPYNVRSLKARWQVTLFSIIGITLAVMVLVVLAAMATGFRIALRSTGRIDNAIVIEKGMASELMSDVSIENAAAIVVDPRIARDADGRALASPEIQALISLPRTDERAQVNVAVRGVTPQAFEVRGGFRVVEGRPFTPGASEIIVGRRIRDRFGLVIGSKLMIRRTGWEVVGVFTSQGSGFESEIWGDLHTLAGPLRRTKSYQAIVVRVADPGSLPGLHQIGISICLTWGTCMATTIGPGRCAPPRPKRTSCGISGMSTATFSRNQATGLSRWWSTVSRISLAARTPSEAAPSIQPW